MENKHVSDALSLIKRAVNSKQGLQDPAYDQLVDQNVSSLIRLISEGFGIELNANLVSLPFCCGSKKLEGASLSAYDDLEVAVGLGNLILHVIKNPCLVLRQGFLGNLRSIL